MTPESLSPALSAAYGWSGCHFVERLAGGEWNEVWQVQADSGDFVVRIAPPGILREALKESHRLMVSAARQVSGVFPPVCCLSGETVVEFAGRLGAVMPFVQGQRAERERIDPELAGTWLGKLHQVSVQEPGQLPQDSFRALPAYASALAERGIDLAALRDKFNLWRQELIGQPSGLLQGDYYPSNIIVAGGSLAGVIDWDEASVGPLAWELGRALWEFAGDAEKGILNKRTADAFLCGYVKAGGPEPDYRLLAGAMAQNRLWDALWAFQDPNGFEENLQYHLHHLRAMEWIQELVF